VDWRGHNTSLFIHPHPQFNARPNHTITYKHTSNLIDYMTFMYTITDRFQSSAQRVHISNDIDVGMFVIISYNDNFHLTLEVQVQYYEPSFPSTTFYVSRSKNRHSCDTNIQNIFLHLRHDSVVGDQDEVYLNHEQFNDIENICEEF
jgi:hypothetical protein